MRSLLNACEAAESHGRRHLGHTGPVTTRIGFLIILGGVVLICLRAVGMVDTELADIISVLLIVLGALAVAIDGEAADQSTKPKRRDA